MFMDVAVFRALAVLPLSSLPRQTFSKISVCLSLKHKSPKFVCSIAKYKANSHHTLLAVAAMIEPASLVWRKTNAIQRKEGEKGAKRGRKGGEKGAKRGRKGGEKGYERKFALKTILKFYPKIEHLYQGILHENILETRLVKFKNASQGHR